MANLLLLSDFSLETAEIIEALKTRIAEGKDDDDIDVILGQIAESAQSLTGATGAAIAVLDGREVLCRARNGNTAPPLGSRLDVNSGISGECLLTGEILRCDDTEIDLRVDPEVCRLLELRSMVVVPVRGENGIAGILEVFSTRPHAFATEHIDSLKNLAELVELACTSKFVEGFIAAPRREAAINTKTAVPEENEEAPRPIALPVALFKDQRHYWIAGGAAAALLLMIFISLKTFRAAEKGDASEQAAQLQVLPFTPSAESMSPATTANLHKQTNREHRSADGKRQGLQKASKVDVLSRTGNLSSASSEPLKPPVSALSRPVAPSHDINSNQIPIPPPLTTESATSEALLVPSATLPKLAPPISQGITGGTLEHRVKPIYPQQAAARNLEGSVVLQATITKMGDVHDPKLLRGSALLGQAAITAVKQWHYQPYRLNGEPIEMQTEITVKFKTQ
jgi:TonB family protein